MSQDADWKTFFLDDGRYADIINGIACGGRQVVSGDDLQEMDTQAGLHHLHGLPHKGRGRTRDTIRRVAFGVSFAVIGIENQEEVDYALPLRILSYDVGDYERQAAGIRREVRRHPGSAGAGEYLYGFRRDSRLHPAMTIVLYAGQEGWDGATSLHGILDLAGIPEGLRGMVADYPIHLVEIRRLEDTSVFRTDVRQVFDFIRCSGDKERLLALVHGDAYYRGMDEDAFDVVAHYTSMADLARVKDAHRKDGKVDMGSAITELIEDGRKEGRTEGLELGRSEGLKLGRSEGLKLGRSEGLKLGRSEGLKLGRSEGLDQKTRAVVSNMLSRGMDDADIRALAECGQDLIDEVRKGMKHKK